MIKKFVSLLVVLLSTLAVLFATGFVPTVFFKVGSAANTISQSVKAKDLTLVCPGAVVQGASSGKVGSFSRSGSASIDYATNLPAGVTISALKLVGVGAKPTGLVDSGGSIANFAADTPVALTVADPRGIAKQGSALLDAQNYQISSSASLVGALGANCQSPSAQQLFVGASTAIGRESLLLVSNPSATDATVSLHLFGDNGEIGGAGLNGIAVAANRSIVLPLASYAPDNSVLAVQLDSQGASVASWIQQKTVRGTLAGGAELISPVAMPAKNLVIPGLLKRGTSDAAALIAGNADYADLTPRVNIFVPGSVAANVTVQVIGTDSKTFGTVLQQTIGAGQANALPITGLKDGDYSVFVSADQPVIASAQLSRTLTAHATAGQNSTTDFAVLSSIEPSQGSRSMPVPQTGISRLSIASSAAGAANVTIKSHSGSQLISVAKLSSRVIALEAGSVVSISSDAPVAATMVVDFNSMIVAIPSVDFSNQGGTIQIAVR